MSIKYGVETEVPTPEIVPQAMGEVISFHRFDIEAVKPRFSEYSLKIRSMLQEAQALKIKDQATYDGAAALSLAARKLTKEIEKKRNEYLEIPEIEKIREFEKNLKTFCKMFTDNLKQVEIEADGKITQYKAVIEQQRREAELAAQKATQELQDKLNKEAKEKGIAPVEVPAPVIPKDSGPVRTDHGSLSTRTYWEFKVVDIKKVPYEFQGVQLVGVLDGNVRKLIQGGIREISGLEIYSNERTVKRT